MKLGVTLSAFQRLAFSLCPVPPQPSTIEPHGSLREASGCLPVGYQMASGWLRGGFRMAPLPCRFPPPGFIDNRPLAISSPVGLHYLSAFCPPGSRRDEGYIAVAKASSPLPFGVLPPR